MSSQHEDFQDYMDGGVRRRLVRHSLAKRPAAAKKPKAAVAKRRSPSVAKRANMARLFGGFFESLEDFANDSASTKDKKDKVSESYADEKNPMAPLAVKGGKPKRKVVKPKPKRKPVRRATYGGFEEEEQSEEFMNINEALSQAKELISGGYRHHVARRPVRPVARRPVPRRPVARRPVRRFM